MPTVVFAWADGRQEIRDVPDSPPRLKPPSYILVLNIPPPSAKDFRDPPRLPSREDRGFREFNLVWLGTDTLQSFAYVEVGAPTSVVDEVRRLVRRAARRAAEEGAR